MKSHRLQLAVLLAAVASLLVFGALPAYAAQPSPPTALVAQAGNAAATVSWTAGATNGATITGFVVTTTGTAAPGPVTVGATSSSAYITGLTNGDAYTFSVHATSVSDGDSTESAPSSSVTPTSPSDACKIDSFPAVPGGSSELAVACTLTTATGGGNNYKVEDYPQAQWHQGAGRSITVVGASAAPSKVIHATASLAHFTAQDINDTIAGPGIPSNTFIVAFTPGSSTVLGTVTLNKPLVSPGVANGAKLIIENSDGRTFTDAGPLTHILATSNGVDISTFTGSGVVNVTAGTGLLFPTSGTLQVGLTTANTSAKLSYTNRTANQFQNVTTVSGTGTLATGKVVTQTGETTITSAMAHFCTTSILNCGTVKNDVGRTLSGTIIQHGTTILNVSNSGTAIVISKPTIDCPLVNKSTAVNCQQIGISGPSNLTTARQVKDATYVAGAASKVCSVSAGFNQNDVNLPISNVLAGKIPANDYIASVSGNCATIHTPISGTSANANVVIGTRNSTSPLNGDAVVSLASELSVVPSLAAGEPDCSSNSAVGSNLVGKWNNPGAFDTTALGQPGAAITGPMIAQLDIIAGTTTKFAGYVMLSNGTGDSDTAAHVDIIFPSLLTGTAVCPTDVGVATVFRFFGETLSQSAAGSGDVREFKDMPGNQSQLTGQAWEHVVSNPSTPLFTTSDTCTISFPTTIAGYACGGN